MGYYWGIMKTPAKPDGNSKLPLKAYRFTCKDASNRYIDVTYRPSDIFSLAYRSILIRYGMGDKIACADSEIGTNFAVLVLGETGWELSLVGRHHHINGDNMVHDGRSG